MSDILGAFLLGIVLLGSGYVCAGPWAIVRKYESEHAFSTAQNLKCRLTTYRAECNVGLYYSSAPGQHTLGHVSCAACEAATRDILMSSELASLPFERAAALWLDNHRHYIRAATAKDYEVCIAALKKFLSGTVLGNITIGTIREYQRWRAEQAGPSRVNHECCCLTQILRHANLWGPIAPHFKSMPMPKPRIGKAISPEEEDRLFEKAAKGKKRWQVAYWCSSLMANTAAGPAEIRNLRVGDVDLVGRTIQIREGTKNDYRVRRIPLNHTAYLHACRLVDRYRDLCAKEGHQESPDDCLLPHRAHKLGAPIDFSVPMGSWRKAWERIRKAAGLEHVRQYDLRHHAITRMLENPDVSEETVKSIAGHVSKRILQTYSHIRQSAKRAALDALERKPIQKGIGFGNQKIS